MRAATNGLAELELKARVAHIIAALQACLPESVPAALEIAVGAGQDLEGFSAWPVIDFVGEHGRGHFAESMEALRRLTARFTGEFAIRGFIEDDEKRALGLLRTWTRDPSEHVRRLVSEGTRPRLPWGARLRSFQRDPSPVIELLELLKDDASETVRRSVANNLNDIAKDHPERVIELCGRWWRGASPERKWIVTRALRTRIKAGDRQALGVLGYDTRAIVGVRRLQISPQRVSMGQALTLSFELVSKRAARLVVDYAVHHVKHDGTTSPKVFKLTTLEVAAGEIRRIAKRHAFREITTRKYYSGRHALELFVNGKSRDTLSFELKVEASRARAPRAAPGRRGRSKAG